jgi:hypothetical protein
VPLFEVAADPDSSFPFLIRLPLPTGELVLKARDSWPRTAKVYCQRAENGWRPQPKILERVPIPVLPAPWRRDRPPARPPVREPLAAGVHPHTGWPWGDLPADAAHHPPRPTRNPRSPPARCRARRLTILIDTRERYPYKFAQQQASTERQALRAGDYGIAHDGEIIAVVERKVSTTSSAA